MKVHFIQKIAFVQHLLPLAVLAVHWILFRWLWTRSSITKATIESGRTIFPPVREIRILFAFIAFVIAALLIWCSLTLQPSEWWLPYACLALLMAVPFMVPPVLTIDVEGIVSRTRLGYEKKIRWRRSPAFTTTLVASISRCAAATVRRSFTLSSTPRDLCSRIRSAIVPVCR